MVRLARQSPCQGPGHRLRRDRLTALTLLLVGFNIAPWLGATVAFRGHANLVGLALLAWMFGLRHAFDANHIAAINNVVRKLVQSGQRPIGTGFFFSLGHSIIVVLASIVTAVTVRNSHAWLDSSETIGGFIGAAISALFLFGIAIANWKENLHRAECSMSVSATTPIPLCGSPRRWPKPSNAG